MGKAVDFNSVSKQSRVSNSFLYSDEEMKERIEELSKKTVNKEMNKGGKIR